MAKKPKLDALDDLFAAGKDFQISDRLYEEKTGAALPKTKTYLLNRSALAQKAKDMGYEILCIEEKPVIERIVQFKKRG